LNSAVVLNLVDESIKVKEKLKGMADVILRFAEEVASTLRSGGKVILFGNGGSAADAQHIAAEFVGKFKLVRNALPAIALTTNTSTLTAIANDISFDDVFVRQVEALVSKGDLVVGISTSGRSANVIKAIVKAKELGAKTVALTGGDGGELAKKADLAVIVPSDSTPRIQEAHITIGHIVCELVERELSGNEAQSSFPRQRWNHL
jgi:D-sedoheptulose 7-phosphate isomerase